MRLPWIGVYDLRRRRTIQKIAVSPLYTRLARYARQPGLHPRVKSGMTSLFSVSAFSVRLTQKKRVSF